MKSTIRKYFALASAALCLLIATSYWVSAHASSETRKFVVSLSVGAGELVSQSQLKASEASGSVLPETQFGVSLQEEFRADKRWFLHLNAPDQAKLEEYFKALDVKADSIMESLFINSPELGGGPKAGEVRDGHKIYMIERDIPGVGLAPHEKLVEVSKGSQGIIEKLGDGIEWDHSFLTSEGTFCVYRAGDTDIIQEHAKLAGINANPTAVEHIVRNFNH